MTWVGPIYDVKWTELFVDPIVISICMLKFKCELQNNHKIEIILTGGISLKYAQLYSLFDVTSPGDWWQITWMFRCCCCSWRCIMMMMKMKNTVCSLGRCHIGTLLTCCPENNQSNKLLFRSIEVHSSAVILNCFSILYTPSQLI